MFVAAQELMKTSIVRSVELSAESEALLERRITLLASALRSQGGQIRNVRPFQLASTTKRATVAQVDYELPKTRRSR
jgi:hypothetical protein